MESNRRYQAWVDRQAKAAEQAPGDKDAQAAILAEQVHVAALQTFAGSQT